MSELLEKDLASSAAGLLISPAIALNPEPLISESATALVRKESTSCFRASYMGCSSRRTTKSVPFFTLAERASSNLRSSSCPAPLKARFLPVRVTKPVSCNDLTARLIDGRNTSNLCAKEVTELAGSRFKEDRMRWRSSERDACFRDDSFI